MKIWLIWCIQTNAIWDASVPIYFKCFMKNVKYVFSLIVLFLCQEAVQQAVRYFPCYKPSTNDGYSYYHNLQICPKTFICFSWNDTTLYAVVKNFVNKWVNVIKLLKRFKRFVQKHQFLLLLFVFAKSIFFLFHIFIH